MASARPRYFRGAPAGIDTDIESGILMFSRKIHPFNGTAPKAGYRKAFEQDVSRELGLGVDISMSIVR